MFGTEFKLNSVETFIDDTRTSIDDINRMLDRIYLLAQSVNDKDRKKLCIKSEKIYREKRTNTHRIIYKLWKYPFMVIPTGISILSNNNIVVRDKEFDFSTYDSYTILYDNIIKIENYIKRKLSLLNNVLSNMTLQLLDV